MAKKEPAPRSLAMKAMLKTLEKMRDEKKPEAKVGSLKGEDVKGRVTEESLRPSAMRAQYAESVRPGAKTYPSKRAMLIAEGLFVEKDGDLVPTEKYNRMKASGQLKGKYNID